MKINNLGIGLSLNKKKKIEYQKPIVKKKET